MRLRVSILIVAIVVKRVLFHLVTVLGRVLLLPWRRRPMLLRAIALIHLVIVVVVVCASLRLEYRY
jgi:hypothetical protein